MSEIKREKEREREKRREWRKIERKRERMRDISSSFKLPSSLYLTDLLLQKSKDFLGKYQIRCFDNPTYSLSATKKISS